MLESDQSMPDIYEFLHKLSIPYQKYDHPAVFTVAEANEHDLHIDAGRTKNLFVRDPKKERYYLVVVQSDKRVDIKKLAEKLGEKKFSFASPEDLYTFLKLTPGSVSPFGLINDTKNKVTVCIDNDLLTYDHIGFHPNVNTATLAITPDDFKKFLDATGNKIIFCDFL